MTTSMGDLENMFSRYGTQSSSNSESDQIPLDLLIDIFSRTPLKSIARFRCLSKSWASIFGRPDFKDLSLAISSTRPRILFTIRFNGKLFFFSSPQPQNPYASSSLVATSYNDIPQDFFSHSIRSHINGLVSLQRHGQTSWVMICNPLTGESIPIKSDGLTYFGYDPINKQFKLLSIIFQTSTTYRVLTLGTTGVNHLWRTVEWKPLSSPWNIYDDVCIDGVLYFGAAFQGTNRIVCFDVRSEKFGFVDIDPNMVKRGSLDHWSLFNFKGKLGARSLGYQEVVTWVLDDARGNKWSKSICKFDHSLFRYYEHKRYCTKVVGPGEIMFWRRDLSSSGLEIFFYNMERKIINSVRIHGFEEIYRRVLKQRMSKDVFGHVDISLDYVERI